MVENTSVNPQQALDGAGQLAVHGDALESRWHTLRARIDSLNAMQPWGNDEPGKQFNKNYLAGEHPPATSVLDAGQSMVIAVAKLCKQVREGVEGTASLDDLTAAWFRGE
jgi:hypothetical protein